MEVRLIHARNRHKTRLRFPALSVAGAFLRTQKGRRVGEKLAKARREFLSVEDHKIVAAKLRAIDDAWDRIGDIVNGKVPCPILDQLLTYVKSEKALFRFREDMEVEHFRRHPGMNGLYFE